MFCLFCSLYNTESERRFDASATENLGFAQIVAAGLALFRILMYADKLYKISQSNLSQFPIHLCKVLACFDLWSVFASIVCFAGAFYVKVEVEVRAKRTIFYSSKTNAFLLLSLSLSPPFPPLSPLVRRTTVTLMTTWKGFRTIDTGMVWVGMGLPSSALCLLPA